MEIFFNILLVICLIALAFVFVYEASPRMWLNLSPILITEEGVQLTIRNKANVVITFDKVFIGWKSEAGRFCLQMSDQTIKIPPNAEQTFFFPIKTTEIDDDGFRSIMSSPHHEVILKGKSRMGRINTSIRTTLDKIPHNQRMDPTVKTPVKTGNEQGTAGHT